MGRFLLVCFVFLGAAFYFLSGGANYEPVENSIQVQSQLPENERMDFVARNETEEQTSPTSLAVLDAMLENAQLTVAEEEAEEEITLTLATTSASAASIIEAEANRPKAELLEIELPETLTGDQNAIEAALTTALQPASFDPDQIRWVKDNIIDLRTGPGLNYDRVAQVTKGTEVAVLSNPGNGWLNVQVIENNQSGWVAEWLLVDPQ